MFLYLMNSKLLSLRHHNLIIKSNFFQTSKIFAIKLLFTGPAVSIKSSRMRPQKQNGHGGPALVHGLPVCHSGLDIKVQFMMINFATNVESL